MFLYGIMELVSIHVIFITIILPVREVRLVNCYADGLNQSLVVYLLATYDCLCISASIKN